MTHTQFGRAKFALMAVWLAANASHAGSLDVLTLDRDGKPTADAVVSIYPSGKGAPKTPLPSSAVVSQEKQKFVPRVTVVAVGAKVRFTNADSWNHHVRLGVPGAALGDIDGQSILLEGKTDGKPANSAVLTFEKPGAHGAAMLGCYLHSNMRGTVFVADTPWAAKSGPDGIAHFADVPEGAAMVKVWHQGLLVEKAPTPATVGVAPAVLEIQLNVVSRGNRL
jgi:plastocyanin